MKENILNLFKKDEENNNTGFSFFMNQDFYVHVFAVVTLKKKLCF